MSSDWWVMTFRSNYFRLIPINWAINLTLGINIVYPTRMEDQLFNKCMFVLKALYSCRSNISHRVFHIHTQHFSSFYLKLSTAWKNFEMAAIYTKTLLWVVLNESKAILFYLLITGSIIFKCMIVIPFTKERKSMNLLPLSYDSLP